MGMSLDELERRQRVSNANRFADLMKAVRMRPLTRKQIREELGWSEGSVITWTRTLSAQGFLEETRDKRAAGIKPPYLYTVAAAWRNDGKAAA